MKNGFHFAYNKHVFDFIAEKKNEIVRFTLVWRVNETSMSQLYFAATALAVIHMQITTLETLKIVHRDHVFFIVCSKREHISISFHCK